MRAAQQRKLQREEAILLSLNKLDYLSRSQIQRMHQLAGDRNARRVLDNMREYVSSFRSETGENVYYLSKAGRELVGCSVVRTKTAQVGHYLMRNDAYIHYQPEEWANERKFTIGETGLSIICDAYFKADQRRCFLEVDRMQNMTRNQQKVEKYKAMKETGVFQEKMKYFPRLVWVTLTESRKKQLAEWCGISGIDTVIHIWGEIK